MLFMCGPTAVEVRLGCEPCGGGEVQVHSGCSWRRGSDAAHALLKRSSSAAHFKGTLTATRHGTHRNTAQYRAAHTANNTDPESGS
eukprot:9486694-Pyramimonas_sp.AAC.2